MTDEQIKHMVNRFLGYFLPDNWKPDGGISFEKYGNKGTPNQYTRYPSGTNLLDATQADAMVRHMIDGMPSAAGEANNRFADILDCIDQTEIPVAERLQKITRIATKAMLECQGAI